MDVLTLITILARRWYVGLPILAVVAAALVLVNFTMGSEYQTSGAFLVVPPNTSTVVITSAPTKVPTNPLLETNQSNLMVAATLAAEASTQQRQDELKTVFGLRYTTTVDSHAALITVVGTAPSADGAVRGVKAVLGWMEQHLVELQRLVGAPPDSLLQGRVVGVSEHPTVQTGGRTKALFLLGVAGVLVAASASLVVDGVVTTRRRPRPGMNGSAGGLQSQSTVSLDGHSPVRAPEPSIPMRGRDNN